VYLDSTATAAKAVRLIAEAASQGAGLIAFPESYLPGFPLWPAVSAPCRNHDFFVRFAEQSVRVDGPQVASICAAAREHQIIVSLGISESTDASVGCLWNSNLLIGSDGTILNHHRKMVPTFFEKMIWANGDASGLRVLDTPVGRVGMLVCGENTNPLARFALMTEGEQIHVSSYPPIWPTHEAGAAKPYDLAHAIRIRAAAHSFEAKTFGVVASSVYDAETREILSELGDEAVAILDGAPQAASMIVDPSGSAVVETCKSSEELLVAEIDLKDCVVAKQFHDVVGYYNRFDIFDLQVDRSRRLPMRDADVSS